MALKPSKEMHRVYDLCIKSWLSGLRVDYGADNAIGTGNSDRPIFSVFATPERAYASMAKLLIEEGFLPQNTSAPHSDVSDENAYKTFIYPFARIQYNGATPSTELARNATILRMSDSDGTSYIQRRAPYPVDLAYSIEFYAKTRSSMNYLMRWLYDQWGRRGAGATEFFIMATHPKPWGDMLVPVQVTGVTDTSILEAEGTDDREIRSTVDFVIRGWQVDSSPDGEGRVPAVYFPTAEVRVLEGSDIALRNYGELIATTDSKEPTIGFDNTTPVDVARSTATALKPLDNLRAFTHSAAGQYVRSVRFPVPTGTLAMGVVRARSVRSTGQAQPMTLRLCWWNRLTDTVTVRQTWSLATGPVTWTDQSFYTVPPANTEVFLEMTTANGAVFPVNSVFGTLRLGMLPPSNLVAVNDRTKGPGLASTQTDVTAATTEAGLHVISVPLSMSSFNKTVTVYPASNGTGSPLGTATVQAGETAEVVVVGAPTSATSGVLVRVTSASVDATLVVGPVTVRRCPRPLAFV